MTEQELQDKIQEMCRERGLWTYHTANSVGSAKGWPDLVIVGTGVLYRELKSGGRVLSTDQSLVGWKLKAARQDWAVWWPKDLGNGNIGRQLDQITEKKERM